MIKLSDSDIGKCYKFAYNVTQLNFNRYKNRNNKTYKEKVIQDHFIAKLTELYLYYYLSEKTYQCTYPDFSINNDRSKYKDDVDMIIIKDQKPINIHIKTCRIDSPISKSWLIQKNTYTVLNPKDNDFFAFCTYNNPENITIDKIIKASDINWINPKFNLPSKLACYLDSIEK